jgi:hypothetical protein
VSGRSRFNTGGGGASDAPAWIRTGKEASAPAGDVDDWTRPRRPPPRGPLLPDDTGHVGRVGLGLGDAVGPGLGGQGLGHNRLHRLPAQVGAGLVALGAVAAREFAVGPRRLPEPGGDGGPASAHGQLTHATLALAAGVHPKVVQERLGHANIAITLDTYSHAVPALEEEAAHTVAVLVFRS